MGGRERIFFRELRVDGGVTGEGVFARIVGKVVGVLGADDVDLGQTRGWCLGTIRGLCVR